jgi:soluble lytic murein transglycosylase-like protein
MDRAALTITAAGLLVLYAVMSGQGAGTAGDDDSNFLLDGIDEVNNMLNGWPTGSGPYQDLIVTAANANAVPVPILAWLLWKESRYSPAIISGERVSRVGAMGIAQFMPATAREELGNEDAALDPSIAIPGAARYLARLYGALGTWAEALAAYNWGIGNVRRKGIDAAPPETLDYYTTILNKAGGVYA